LAILSGERYLHQAKGEKSLDLLTLWFNSAGRDGQLAAELRSNLAAADALGGARRGGDVADLYGFFTLFGQPGLSIAAMRGRRGAGVPCARDANNVVAQEQKV
jgi:hypothetical protein